MSHVLRVPILLTFFVSIPALAEPPGPDVAAEATKVRELSKVREKKLLGEVETRYTAAKTEEEREEVLRWWGAKVVEYKKTDRVAIRPLMPLLQREAANPAAVDGLMLAAFYGDDAARREAGELLRLHHRKLPAVLKLAKNARGSAEEEWIAPLIRDILADDTIPAESKLRIKHSLAHHLKERSELPTRLANWPERAELYVPEVLARTRSFEVDKLEAEALALFDEVALDKSNQELLPGLTLAASAKSEAYEMRYLRVGKVAPEIDGVDLDEKPLRLTDYKGKVTVLTFGTSRCGPCAEFAKHEKKLVERFSGRPFAPVGVYLDEDRNESQELVKKLNISWKSFWSGPKGTNSEIARTWNVQSYPTIYVIDQNGVIRAKGPRGAVLEKLLDELVKKAEADKSK